MNAINHADLRHQFLSGMSRAACTVNIVTTDGEAGRAGVTVSAMSPVSADTDNPTLLVCVHNLSPAAEKIIQNGVFCVNVLRDNQTYISEIFAGRAHHKSRDKFECTHWATHTTGSPVAEDALVSFDCRLVSNIRVGTHFVLFGETVEILVSKDGSPLIYTERAYGSVTQ